MLLLTDIVFHVTWQRCLSVECWMWRAWVFHKKLILVQIDDCNWKQTTKQNKSGPNEYWLRLVSALLNWITTLFCFFNYSLTLWIIGYAERERQRERETHTKSQQSMLAFDGWDTGQHFSCFILAMTILYYCIDVKLMAIDWQVAMNYASLCFRLIQHLDHKKFKKFQ